MATTKITDLTAYTDPVSTDVLPIVDVTSDVTKKVSIANVMKNASLGSASACGVAFDGDPNTGVYSPGSDQVALATGGTGWLFVDSSGRIGLGGVEGTYAASVTTTGDNGFLVRTGTSSADQIYVGNTAGEPAVGTLTADPLNIITNGSTRIRITDTGLVGLGTSTVGNALHIVTSSTTATARGITLSNTNANTANGMAEIDFYTDQYDGSTLNNKARITASLDASSPTAGYLAFSTRKSGVMTEAVRIDSQSRVGIGTTPSATLHVSSASDDILRLTATSPYLSFYNGATRTGYIRSDVAGGGFNIISEDASTPMRFFTSATERCRVTSDGKFLVGTSSAGSGGTLSVNGTISVGGGTSGNQATIAKDGTQQTSGISATATTIVTSVVQGLSSAAIGYVLVHGSDNTSKSFFDVLVANPGVGVNVISSTSIWGTPAARTYTMSFDALRLSMASGTYNVLAKCTSMGFPF